MANICESLRIYLYEGEYGRCKCQHGHSSQAALARVPGPYWPIAIRELPPFRIFLSFLKDDLMNF